jgi:FG-GAP repeat/RTX calcium-binding nonapeptide repeat (4 copies)
MAAQLTYPFTRSFFARLLSSAALLFAVPAMAGEFQSSIGLIDIDGATGFRINGEDPSVSAGWSVAAAGDVNGDGFGDVIVGAPGSSVGLAYVVFGSESGTNITDPAAQLTGDNGFRIKGADAYNCGGFGTIGGGASVGGAGDVNGDGFDDVIFGSPNADIGALDCAGAAYVVFGGPAGTFAQSVFLETLAASQGFKVSGSVAGDTAGGSVSGAGDVNGDGFDDVIIGVAGATAAQALAGRAYILFGGASRAGLSLSDFGAADGVRLDGPQFGAVAGSSVSRAGDVNGDGFADVIVGAPFTDYSSKLNAGASYVVFGGSTMSSVLGLAAPDGITHFRMFGRFQDDYSGTSVGAAGDVNGDGLDDVIIGARNAEGNAMTRTGLSFVVFGRETFPGADVLLSSLDGGNGFRLEGENTSDESGFSVSGGTDINGDGYDDVIAGSLKGEGAEADAGSAHVVFGHAGGFAAEVNLADLDGDDGFELRGEADSDAGSNAQAGRSVAGAGDVNGDGFGDVIVGSPGTDPATGFQAGTAYVIYGREPTISVVRAGSDASQTIQGSPFADGIWGAAGNDILEGRGGGDILDGSLGRNTASYAHAPSGVIANLTTPLANNGDANGDIYVSTTDLLGSPHNDTLTGNAAVNRLTGGKGKDILKGGKGKDVFAYILAADSPTGAVTRDEITDFKPGTASKAIDKIDVSAIDAKSAVNGNQAFTFRGTKPFTAAGQLRIKKSGANIVVQGNTGASNAAEFEILLKGLTAVSAFSAKDFKL